MLAAIQRKQAQAYAVVKCTCECDDLLFLRRAEKIKTGQPASVWTPHTLKLGCMLYSWSHKHCATPEQISDRQRLDLWKYLMFCLYGRQNIMSAASSGMEKIWEHSMRCDVRFCIHFVIWLNQKSFHSDLYPPSKASYHSLAPEATCSHTHRHKHIRPSLCIPLQSEGENMRSTLLDTCCLGFLPEYLIWNSHAFISFSILKKHLTFMSVWH